MPNRSHPVTDADLFALHGEQKLKHQPGSIEYRLPHACECLSQFEQPLIHQSPAERELSNLISDQRAKAQ